MDKKAAVKPNPKAAKDSAKERKAAEGKQEQSVQDVQAAEKARTSGGQERMVDIHETGLAGPGERTKDGGTSGNPSKVPEGTSAAQYQRGANIQDKGLQDAPGSRPLALKQAVEAFKRQMETMLPEWSQNENKLIADKIEELAKLVETSAGKQQPDGFVSAKA